MDISILRYLDVLIGFVLVMALASSFVTLLTQLVLSNEITQTRAKFLEQGIAALLDRANPTLAPHADEIAGMVLQSGIDGVNRQVIMREQLVRRLMEIVIEPPTPTLQSAKDALSQLFSDALDLPGRIEHTNKLLEKIDHKTCQLEVEHPEFASHIIHTQAIIEARAGKFIDAIMTRFDSMSESLTTLFSKRSRIVTFCVSFLVALALPLDSIDLLQRLSTDNTIRDALVTEAIKESALHENAPQPTQPQESNPNIQSQDKTANGAAQQPPINPAGLPPEAKSVKNNTDQPTKSEKETFNPKAKESEAGSAITGNASNQQPMEQTNQAAPPDESNSITIANVQNAWNKLKDPKLSLVSRGGWSEISKSGQVGETILGCFLSALLMTIGAPFWFEVLKNLLKLRPSLAKTDDEAREKRRKDETTTQA